MGGLRNVRRRGGILLLLALTGAARAELFGLAGLAPEGAGEGSAAGAPVEAPKVFRLPRGFEIGRDNLAFTNPRGAVKIESMSGNCYTMALVTKMFYRMAEYRPEEGPRGFDAETFVAAARRGYAAGRFPVRGAPDLYTLTRVPGLDGGDQTAWMRAATRVASGLDPGPVRGPRPADPETLIQLYRIISTIHYLHYLQHSSARFLETTLRSVSRSSGPKEVTLGALAQLRRDLPRGEPGLFMIFNPDAQFGHVVLAYRLEEGEDHADVYLYDNATQVAPVLDETVARVDKETGRLSMFLKDAATGALTPDPGWARSSWWDAERQFATVLPDPNHDPALRRALAGKLVEAARITGTLFAVGDGLRDVTTRAPGTGAGESTLARDLREFLLDLQRVHAGDVEGPPLEEDAGVAEVNRFLSRNADRAFTEIFPFALPEDVTLADTHVRLDERNPNRGWVEVTLTLSKHAALSDVIDALERSALFANEPQVARLVDGVGKAFEGETLTFHLRVEITKQESFGELERLGEYAPVPVLEASHVVIGSLRHRKELGEFADHRVEISEGVVQKLAGAVLRSEGVLGVRHRFAYRIPVLGRRAGSVRFTRMTPFFSRGRAGVGLGFRGFAAVATASRGVNFSSRAAALTLTFTRLRRKNHFRVRGSLAGWHGIELGLGRILDGAVLDVAGSLLGALFPRFVGTLNSVLRRQLGKWVALASGGVSLGTPAVDATRFSATMDRLDVDLGGTVEKLFGQRAPVAVRDVQFEGDRMLLLLDEDP